MTLVRKNIIYPNTWHICYSLSLLINIFILKTFTISQILNLVICNHLFELFRFTLNINKYISWACVFYIFNIDFSYLNDCLYINNVFIWSFIFIKLYILSPLYFKTQPTLTQTL